MKIRIILCVALVAAPTMLFAATNDFNRTLYVGMRGEDVRALQKVLNADTATRIAEAGPGSPSNETDYFGPATKRALIKFQEKYRAEVLAPVGLTLGTGVFGEKTRAKAGALQGEPRATSAKTTIEIPTPVAPKIETPRTPKSETITLPGGKTMVVSTYDVTVMFPSQYSGKPGTTINISGANFTSADNTVYFGSLYSVEKVSSWNANSLTLNIPNIPKGIYPLLVKNAHGESNRDAFFVVTDGVTPEPAVESVTPARAVRGDMITIRGTGFMPKGNMLRTGVGIFKDVDSPDGHSLSFVVPQSFLKGAFSTSTKKVSLPVWVRVVNENGVSNGKSFVLSI